MSASAPAPSPRSATAAPPAALPIASDQASAETIVDLARALIAIDTAGAPGGELAAAECVARRLAAAGIAVDLLPFGDGRANLVARIRGTGERGTLVFSGHLDTVPVGPGTWSHPPRAGVVDGGYLCGRGSLDMKGPVAAMALALMRLHADGATPAGDVVLALTSGEETDSCGARLLTQAGHLDGTELIVVGEATDFDVGIAHRGALWVRVETHGTRGHGSQAARESNALWRLLHWLHPLEEIEALVADVTDPLLGRGSVSLTMASGGDAPNVVPDHASAVLDIRTVPGQRHADLLAALRRRAPEATIAVLRDSPPVPVADPELVDAAAGAVEAVTGRRPQRLGLPYLTDASVLVEALGAPAVVVGPGPVDGAHSLDERIAVAALVQATHVFERIARTTMYATDTPSTGRNR